MLVNGTRVAPPAESAHDAGQGRRYRAVLTALNALLGVAFLSYLVLGLSARFQYDDFCDSWLVSERGILGTISRFYFHWTFRPSYLLLDGLLNVATPVPSRLVATGTLLAWGAVLWWTIAQLGSVRRPKRRWGESLLLAQLLLVVILVSVPNVWQSVFWEAGLLMYLAPLPLATLYVGLAARLAAGGGYGTGRGTTTYAFAGLIACLVTTGFVESIATMQLVLLPCLLACPYLSTSMRLARPARALLWGGLAGTGLGSAIAFTAPGQCRTYAG